MARIELYWRMLIDEMLIDKSPNFSHLFTKRKWNFEQRAFSNEFFIQIFRKISEENSK